MMRRASLIALTLLAAYGDPTQRAASVNGAGRCAPP